MIFQQRPVVAYVKTFFSIFGIRDVLQRGVVFIRKL